MISSLSLSAVVLACLTFFLSRSQAQPREKHDTVVVDNQPKIRNFIATDNLYDGEGERRIHYNGITAKETSVTTTSNETGEK